MIRGATCRRITAPVFKKVGSFIELREIEVFGRLSARALELVQQKAAALGDGGVVTMHELFSGFDRITVPGLQRSGAGRTARRWSPSALR